MREGFAMGRYMRKSKVAMESAALGVRTRAKTLAMAQQQARTLQQQEQQQQQQQQQVNVLNFCYLELRSRKLEKFCDGDGQARRCRKPPKTQQRRAPQSIGLVSVGPAAISRSNSFSSIHLQASLVPVSAAPVPDEDVQSPAVAMEFRAGEVEASCGDNAFDHDGLSSRDSFGTEHQRRCRESTPTCSEQQLVPEAPGSSSRVRLYLTSNTISVPAAAATLPAPSSSLHVPTAEDIENFLASREEPADEKSRLSDRYNYDFVNDVPLPGRFEWTTGCCL